VSAGKHHWWRWLLGAAVGLVVLVVGAAFVYIHFIEAPAKPALVIGATGPVGASLTAPQVDGKWAIAPGSQAGYRVHEVLAGLDNKAVGRTTAVTGTFTISGTSVQAGGFTVDLRKVTSDSGQRDAQFNGRIMDTAQFPNAVFTLTSPIALASLPKTNQTITVKATGTLAMHGVTKPVSFSMNAVDTGSQLVVQGEIPVLFADWNISNPSFGSFVTTDDHGVVEFKLLTQK
jgi:polyisoprenoid-binding protein YceI